MLGDASSSPAELAQARSFTRFDIAILRQQSLLGRLSARFLDNPQWLFCFFRRFWPNPHVPFTKWWFVSRFDDVQDVLTRDEVFETPFGARVAELPSMPNFLLGLPRGKQYWDYNKLTARIFPINEVPQTVTPMMAREAHAIVHEAAGSLDAVETLITKLAVLACEQFYGLPIEAGKRVEFAHWTLAISTYLFADPNDTPALRDLAEAGSQRLRAVIDRGIDAGVEAAPAGTILCRLLEEKRRDPEVITDEVIRAMMIGMVNGFVPTNTMAGGNVLEVLLRRPDFMAAAQKAALAGDDGLLQQCLFEAMRFKPLNPGPFRVCPKGAEIPGGIWRATRVKPGGRLLVSTQSAMFDQRRVTAPKRFDPGRPSSHSMLFGYGLHWCIGAFIAQAHITQAFKALLRQGPVQRARGDAGKLQRLGPFPEHLHVVIGSHRAGSKDEVVHHSGDTVRSSTVAGRGEIAGRDRQPG